MMSALETAMNKYPSLRKTIEKGIEWNDGREEQLLNFILTHPELDAMKGTPATLLAAMDDFSHTQDFLISIGPHKAGLLAARVQAARPRTVVELGGYLGYSAILFADALRRAAVAGFHVYSIEREPRFAAIAERLVALAGLQAHVSVVVAASQEGLASLQADGRVRALDMLFLDHDEQLYKPDFLACRDLGLFRVGTMVVADNVLRPGAPEYRELVRGDPRLATEAIRGLIQPGDLEDEIDVTFVKEV